MKAEPLPQFEATAATLPSGRTVLDPLYGDISLPDFVWDLLTTPELQRLREVRLSNINSPALLGATSITRFEHSVGVSHLASVNARATGLSEEDTRLLVLACLLHDLGSAAFGHSIQYALQGAGFRHNSLYELLAGTPDQRSGFEYQHNQLESVYFGAPRAIREHLSDADLGAISALVAGDDRLGALVSGTMDLDNIDNVFRLAYHMGTHPKSDAPVRLAEAMQIGPGETALAIDETAIPAVEEWQTARSRLYDRLLLDEQEAAANCMIADAVRATIGDPRVELRWQDVDFQVAKALWHSTDRAKKTITRLMLGDVYGCIGLLETTHTSAAALVSAPDRRDELERSLSRRLRSNGGALRSADVAVHPVLDVARTTREVTFSVLGGEKRRLGRDSQRLLIGLFLRNAPLSAAALRGSSLLREAREPMQHALSGLLGISDLAPARPAAGRV